MSNVSTLSYPRTGKRGVPQQFPRRLYEMLESEAKLAESKPDETYLISWSDSGKAFRITDVDDFAATVLPRYFRTKKFSSFQRNLNLYGFTKVRRGPDTDMYAHSSFVRSHPEMLSELRKSSSASRRRTSRVSSEDSDSTSSGSRTSILRSVSPSSSPNYSASYFQPIAKKRAPASKRIVSPPQCVTQPWMTFKSQPMILSKPQAIHPRTEATGRLDLLALAIERESCLLA